jgi:hypothetical protein
MVLADAGDFNDGGDDDDDDDKEAEVSVAKDGAGDEATLSLAPAAPRAP